MTHIVLVGLMGVGKTTVGRRVANRLQRPFVDADDALEAMAGASVREVFERDGEDAFRQLESRVLGELLGAPQPTVIAAGGGVVLRPENRRRLLGPEAFVVWLHGEPAFLGSRVARKESRPLLDGQDPVGVLVRLAAEREPFYREVADVVVDVRGHYESHPKPKAKDRLADEVVALWHEHDVASSRPGMDTVTVALGERSYDVVVGPGAAALLPDLLPPGARRAAIVTQASIGFDVDPQLEHRLFAIADGEDGKTLASVEQLCREWSQWGLTRGDVVVAVGGGVVTDVGGFAAAVYHRGVPVVHVPTTLLGMVDAAIGGKTGVNLPEGKNLVGAFWQPRAVLCDTDALRTLPPRELRSGWGEVAKYHFLSDVDLDALDEGARIAACARIKAEVVSGDEREGGGRAVLNYGHTLAHALETAGRYDLRHGEAVAIGLVYAAEVARRLGRISPERVAEHRRVVGSYDLPTKVPDVYDTGELVALFGRDKKSVDGVTFVLDGPDGVEPVRVDDEGVLRDALEALR